MRQALALAAGAAAARGAVRCRTGALTCLSRSGTGIRRNSSCGSLTSCARLPQPAAFAAAWQAVSALDVAGVTADSRQVVPGDLFAALPGSRADGRAFIADAVARGAVAVLAPRRTPTGRRACRRAR